MLSRNFSCHQISCYNKIALVLCKQEQCFPLNLKSDQYLISPYSNTTESFIEVMRIKEMITNLRSFNSQTNSLGLYHRKCIENSMENIDTDVWV